MSNVEITKYFDATELRGIRDDLIFAVKNVSEPKVAIDCGCGAGSDINYLVENDFTVYGFDVEEESISRCKSRFEGIDSVTLSRSTFSNFDYPKASLVVPDAGLFFCPRSEFENVWGKIYECLNPGGVFWPEVMVFEESEFKGLFQNFEVLRFKVHKSTGKTPQDVSHNWHIFQVVVQKPNKSKHAEL